MKIFQSKLPPILANWKTNPTASNNTDSSKADPTTAKKLISDDFFGRWQVRRNEEISNRKSAAKARIAELKQRIENMMRFAHVGKGNPRIVADLAKELKTLIAQYGGSASAVSIPAMSNESSASSSAADKAALSENGTDVESSGRTSEESPAATQANNEREPNARADSSPHNAINTSLKQQSGDAGDSAFFTEAKKLAQMLKQLLAIENRKLKTEADQKELRAAKRAIDEVGEAMEKAVEDLRAEQEQLNGASTSNTYDASGASAVASTHNISILA